ncbi:MAG TPA: cytochrome c oxidase subunit 3 [Candidatus Limnocylindrales bacterium]|nr:cytochrome c oxidase subunit 3 [Candidatus Limnocylindrales bacterium]
MTASSVAVTTGDAGHTVAEHSPVGGLAHDSRGGISNPILGMLLFICSEVMFFSGLFAAYFSVRASSIHWPPIITAAGTDPAAVEAAKKLNEHFNLHAEPFFAAALTAVLITSSFTCQFAVWAIRRDDRTGFIRNIGVTLVLGIVFLLGQLYDYSTIGFGISDTPFGTTFYTLTGFHGAHVFGGAVMLSVVLYRGMAGQFSARHHDAVEATSLYWHFVDVVWIALFSTLYIL